MKIKFVRRFLLSSCILVPVAAVTPALAQFNEMSERDAIVVTALKQDTSVRDTPATVTVLGQEEIGAANIATVADLGGVIPGYVTQRGVAGASQTFRGLGSGGADPSIEASVATFVDGIYFGHTRDLVMPLYDLEGVEFIPGTQGALLGKNSSLGAVSIKSRAPGSDLAFNATAGYSTGIDAFKIEGGVDVPFGDSVSARVAGFWNKQDGNTENGILGRSERRLEQVSGRITLAGDLGSVGDFKFLYQHDERDGDGHDLEILTDPNFAARGLAGAIGQPGLDVTGNDFHQSGSEGFGGAPAGPGQFDDQSGDKASLIVNLDVGDRHTLTTQTSYVSWETSRVTDLDFTRFQVLDLIDDEKKEAWSQEIRISSDDSKPLSYLAGAYFYRNDYTLNRGVTAPSPILPFNGTGSTTASIETTSWSVFASGKLELTDNLAVTAGLRYTDEKKTAKYFRTTTGNIGFVLGQPFPLATLPSQSTREVDGNVGIQYQTDAGSLFYVSFARGTKSGGFQSDPSSFAVAAFSGEAAYTIEAGAKFKIEDTATATLAVFNTTVDGFQVGRVQTINGFPQVIIDNSNVRSLGVEGSFQWDVTDSISLDASFLYADAQFTESLFSDDGAGGQILEAFDGMRLPRSPEFSGRIGANYEREIGGGLAISAGGSVRYTGDADIQFSASNPLSPIMEAHAVVDLRLGIGAEDGSWELAVVGNNIFDDRYTAFTTDYPLDPTGDAYYGTLSRPRTVAFQFSVDLQ